MSQRWIFVGTPLVVLLLLGLSLPPSVRPPSETSSHSKHTGNRPYSLLSKSTLHSLAETGKRLRVLPAGTKDDPDTLRTSTDSGTPVILSLPSTLNDTPVTRYTPLKAPSLSGVAGRSFTWIPRGTNPGTYDVSLQAHHPDTAPDTLVVRISLES